MISSRNLYNLILSSLLNIGQQKSLQISNQIYKKIYKFYILHQKLVFSNSGFKEPSFLQLSNVFRKPNYFSTSLEPFKLKKIKYNPDIFFSETIKDQMKLQTNFRLIFRTNCKMGTYLSQPKTDKKIELKRFQSSFVTTCEMQGWRKLMEDAIVCQQISKGVELYCVFDGHGGPQVSTWVSRNLPQQLVSEPNFKQKNYSKALTNTFKKIDQMLRSQKSQTELKKIHKELKLPVENDVENIAYRAGCTANVLLITKQKIIVANIGDSRSVLCKNGLAVPLSFDHKPESPEESKRINSAGAYIKNGRINGEVNLSRAFGDFEYKSISTKKYNQQPVISVPDIIEYERSHQDAYIVMGCDGIWQRFVNNNQKMIDYIKEMREKEKDKKQFVEKFVDSLLGKSVKQQYGLDNMSVIFIDFV